MFYKEARKLSTSHWVYREIHPELKVRTGLYLDNHVNQAIVMGWVTNEPGTDVKKIKLSREDADANDWQVGERFDLSMDERFALSQQDEPMENSVQHFEEDSSDDEEEQDQHKEQLEEADYGNN